MRRVRRCGGAWRSVVVPGGRPAGAAPPRGASRIAPATPIFRRIASASRWRWATTITPVSTVASVRITLLILVSVPTRITIAVTVTVVAIPVATVICVTMRPTVTHVLARGRRMRTVGHRIVHTNATTIQVHTVKLLDASCSVFDGSHFDKAEPTGSIRPLIVDDSDLLNAAKT